jgi:hypothetical protein
MMILNINTTSTPNQFKAFGETVNVPYRVTLRDYTLANETRNGNYGKDKSGNNIYNENLYDLMGVVKNGKLVLSSRWESEIGDQNGYDLNDTTAIEAAIKSWEDIVTKRGRIFAKDGSSKITRKLLVADPPPVDSPKEKTSDEGTGSLFPNLDFEGAFNYKYPIFNNSGNFDTNYRFGTAQESSTKTVKHPSTFRGKTLTLGKKVQVNDLSRVFGSQDGKVYVELTEKGYIVSSPALTTQYLVNVNSLKSSQVIRQLEATVKKVETAVDNKIKPKDEDVSKTLGEIQYYTSKKEELLW